MTDPVFEPSSQARWLGAACVLDKPFDLDELCAAALHLAQPGEP